MRLILLFSFLLPVSAISQGGWLASRDSLMQVAASAAEDSTRALAMMEAGKLFLRSQPDTAARYLLRALDLATEAEFVPGRAKSLINLSFALNSMGKFDSAILLCRQAIPLCQEGRMNRELSAAWNNLGNGLRLTGKYEEAIDAYYHAIEAMKHAEVPRHFPAAVMGNIADLYGNLKQPARQQEAAAEAFRLAQQADDPYYMAISANSVGLGFARLGELDSSRSWYTRSNWLAAEAGAPGVQSVALMNIGELELDEGNLEKAENHFQLAQQLALQAEDSLAWMMAQYSLAISSLMRNDLAPSESFSKSALSFAEKTGNLEYQQALLHTLSDISLARQDWSAYQHFRNQARNIEDSLVNQAVIRSVQEMETKYETAQKETQILRQRESLEAKNRALIGVSGLAGLMLLSIFLGWRNFRHRRRILSQELELKQKTIQQFEQEKQLSVAHAVLQGQEKERSRLARDLHDGLGGMLSGIRQSMLSWKSPADPALVPEGALQHAIRHLDQAITEMRHIARNMMPESLLKFGLPAALQDFCDHIRQNGKISLRFQAFHFEKRIPEEVEVVLFRIAQELLNNVIRHAEASQVLVQLIRDENRVSLAVEDDGKGFDPAQLASEKGVGWMNIQSRVQYLQGTVDLRSAPGKGCSVHIECHIP